MTYQKGDIPFRYGKGKGVTFLSENATHTGSDCLPWPYNRLENGYGTFGYKGKPQYAHRFMCELAHGPAPSAGHEAAHSCGNRTCVNPGHLSWKTKSANQLDRHDHGTMNQGMWRQRRKRLTAQQRDQIIAMKGQRTQRELAEMFGVTYQNISHIQRQGPDRVMKQAPFEPHEDQFLLRELASGTAWKDIAKALGRTISSVEGRAARLRRSQCR